MDRRSDPRSIVTPYAFAVHPDLLGRPLATPAQRLGAILVDLVVIGLLAQIGGAPLAFASAILLFWLAFRKQGRDVFGKLFRIAVGCLGVLVVLVSVVVVLIIRFADEAEQLAQDTNVSFQLDGAGANPGEEAGLSGEAGLLDVIQSVQGAFAFQNAETPEQAQETAHRLARSGQELGLSRSDIRASITGLIPEDASWADQADDIIAQAMQNVTQPSGEGVAEGEAGEPEEEVGDPIDEAGDPVGEVGDPAEEAGDPQEEATPTTEEAPAITDPGALDSIGTLNQTVEIVREQRDSYRSQLATTQAALAEAEGRGLFDWFKDFIDDLGIGFGWGALYLTIAHAWWKGTSVGKKLFRIRVVMIDKRPLNWWLSFERSGGYAAGFATGLLGFAQIFWDPNRQAIHDKVSETFVIQDGKDPIPGPWMEEGKRQWNKDLAAAGNPE